MIKGSIADPLMDADNWFHWRLKSDLAFCHTVESSETLTYVNKIFHKSHKLKSSKSTIANNKTKSEDFLP